MADLVQDEVRITQLELEVEAARRKLQELEQRLSEERYITKAPKAEVVRNRNGIGGDAGSTECRTGLPGFTSAAVSLTKCDVERYSRQMMVEGIGSLGMERIRKGRVLLVGAGGLGSTVGLFLSAAGVGELKIVDFDTVELSNLHRQVMHTTERAGWRKVDSAVSSCLAINPNMEVHALPVQLDPTNAESLVAGCDVVVDGTDNVAARYLINDAAVRQQKPIVSGAAMRWDGQLSVYGYNGGPCQRCIFPIPPPPEAVGSCNDTGVMGPVPGCIGCLQAMEVLKILAGAGDVLSGRMLLFDGLRFQMRVVNLRGRVKSCPACGDLADKSKSPLAMRQEYLPAPCSSASIPGAQTLPKEAQILPRELGANIGRKGGDVPKWIIVDVRVREQYDMAHLHGSVSLPLWNIQKWQRDGVLRVEWESFIGEHLVGDEDTVDVYFMCRRGIASRRAVQLLLPLLAGREREQHRDLSNCDPASAHQPMARMQFRYMNVEGGLNRWHHEVDSSFPYY